MDLGWIPMSCSGEPVTETNDMISFGRDESRRFHLVYEIRPISENALRILENCAFTKKVYAVDFEDGRKVAVPARGDPFLLSPQLEVLREKRLQFLDGAEINVAAHDNGLSGSSGLVAISSISLIIA